MQVENPKRILIVDDHHMTRSMVYSILRSIGYSSTVQAENGHYALEKLQEYHFDLVICDWNMPEMSGLQLLQEVRKNDKWKKMPFLMLTAEAYRENISAAINAGVTDYVVKPFTSEVLAQKVTRLLGNITNT